MLFWKDAKILINETRALRYRGTWFERGVVERLEAMTPARLTEEDEKTLVLMYRRAAGGEPILRG